MSNKHWTPTDVQRTLANPFYCVDETIPEEEWIKAGVRLIGEIGAEQYLRLLLENVKANHRGK
jgi:hypothetical protein